MVKKEGISKVIKAFDDCNQQIQNQLMINIIF